MKKRTYFGLPSFFLSILLGSLIGISCLMCLGYAFTLPCRPKILLPCFLGISIVAAGIFTSKATVPLSLSALGLYLAAVFLLRKPIYQGMQTVLYLITHIYAQYYTGIPIWGHTGGDCTLFLLFAMAPLVWLTTYVTCRRVSAFWVLLACLPVLLLCLIIVDIAPVFWLILLTAGLFLLLMTNSVREVHPNEAGRLGWWLVLPTVILITTITALWPPAAYERAPWSDTLQTLAEAKLQLERMTTTVLYEGSRWNSELKTVDLQSLGPKVNTGREALRYRSSKPISYLRGVSLGIYEDNAWNAIPQSDYLTQTFNQLPLTAEAAMFNADSLSTVELETASAQPLLYVPYYLDTIPTQGQAVDDAYVRNHTGAKSYFVSYRNGVQAKVLNRGDYSNYVSKTYCQLPEDLAPKLREILSQAGLSQGTPTQISNFVENSAVYDLNTPAVPRGEDFALYFLTQSHQGYCVHFATATTLLLRAANIPARYVTSYSVSGTAADWNTVTEDDAHAWVEYYTPARGWQPLDPTPAANRPQAEPIPTPVPETPTAEPELPEAPPVPEEPKPEAPAPVIPFAPAAKKAALFPLWFLLPPALILPVLRRYLLLARRKEQCTKGHPNRQALSIWRWLCRLSKADGIPLEEAYLVLAEKAKFSQHTLSTQELDQLRQERDRRIEALSNASFGKRLWQQYGLALY